MADTNVGAGSGALSVLAAGAAALARANDLDTALAVIVEAGAAATGAAMAAVFAQDPDRNSLELLLTLGIADDAVEAFEAEVVTNPEHPIHHAALDRTGSLGRVGQTPDGATMTGADLPLVVASSGNVEACVGVLTFGWAGEHAVGTGGGDAAGRRSRTSRPPPSRRSAPRPWPPSGPSGSSVSRSRIR